MSGVVRQELFFFGASVLTGLGLLWLYDGLCVFRKIVPHRNWAVSAEDLLYWCAAAWIIFWMIFETNDGMIRIHAFAGILLGVWTQWRIQSFFQKIWTKLLKKCGKKGKITKNR